MFWVIYCDITYYNIIISIVDSSINIIVLRLHDLVAYFPNHVVNTIRPFIYNISGTYI